VHPRRSRRRLPAWAAATAEARLLALLSPEPAHGTGWTPDVDPAAASPPPRVDPGGRGAFALVAVVVLVVAVVAAQAWRSRPHAVPPRPLPLASAGTDAARVVVDVEGAVRRPGLVTLPRGARVADAVRAAGGTRPGASTAGVNLARLVVDGEQILVGTTAPAPGGPGGSATDALVDLNTATVQQLDALPGVGPVLAQRIVDWRTAHGRFGDVGQLREVDGIGERKYADLAKRVRV
jgi:competence protein ComEA